MEPLFLEEEPAKFGTTSYTNYKIDKEAIDVNGGDW